MNLDKKEIIEIQILLDREMDRCFEQEQFFKTFESKHSESNRDYYQKQYFRLLEIRKKLDEIYSKLQEEENKKGDDKNDNL